MSTNGALGTKLNGVYKIAYNHMDSYPDGLGAEVVNFASKKKNIKNLKKRIPFVKMVSNNDTPTKEDIKKYSNYANLSVSDQSKKDWYCLLRNTQGVETFEEIAAGNVEVMIDSFEFLRESLFCEFAYIINLDEEKLEFYEGFNKKSQEDNPLPFDQKPDKENGYYPVRFKGSCNLFNIPKKWIKKFYPKEEEE